MFRHRLRSSGIRSTVVSGEARGRHRRRHWVLEGLENRTLLSGGPTVYTVDLTSDIGKGSDNTGDLLYCITQANANTNTAGSEIEFDPAVFPGTTQLSITLSATLDLSETAGPEMIDGPGASAVKITGNDTVQVFDESQEDVTASLSGLTIWGGMNSQAGGGIYNDGTLSITSCTFTNNTSGADGGGIANPGTLTVANSTIVSNSAPFGGGIDNEGTLIVTGSTIESNSATSFGGGICNADGGVATFTNTAFELNSAIEKGGGIFNSSFVQSAGASPLTVTGGTFSNNASEDGGGIYEQGDGGDPPNLVKVTDSTFSDNGATGSSSISGGGGFYNQGGTVSISGSTLSGNTAIHGGGGIFANAGALTIMDSTLSGNSVTGSTGPGGGLYQTDGTLSITNSTVAGNSAENVGAGIDISAGTLKAVNCTIADNTEPSAGARLGGGLNVDQGTVTLDNTIVALNTDGTGPGATPDNLYLDGGGTVSSASANNLIGAGADNSGLTSDSNGNLVGVADPGLGRLVDNGGPTLTIAVLAGSPAVDAGNPALAVDPQGHTLTTDQRGTGFPRILNGTVDIGAFEQPLDLGSPTVYIVDLTSDSGASTSATEGDILYCVTQANANTNLAGSEIEFDSTVFSAATPEPIALSSTLELNPPSGPELIEGLGASIVTISGNGGVGATDVFSVDNGVTATLSGLTISHGDIGIDDAGTLTLTNCTIDNNLGGGIANTGTTTVTNSAIDDNGEAVSGTFGGGIDNTGTLTVTDCTLSGNLAGAGGGIDNSGPLTITGSTLSGNSAKVFGGGIDNFAPLTITDSTIEDNSVGANGEGGGIQNGGALSISDCTIEDNSASQADSTADDAGGGGLYNSGTAAIAGSTLSGNSGAFGGAIYVATGTVTVTNSTLAGNTAADGGGIENESDGSTTITSSTLAGNSATRDDGGGIDNEGTAVLYNTIVATNVGGSGAAAPANDITGKVSSSSASNLVGTGGSGGLLNGNNGNLVGVADPDLGTLADNGGPTQTIALLAGSPAIGAGNPNLAVDPEGNALPTDQRGTGFARTVDGKVDIGAFEVQSVTSNPVPTLSTLLPNRIVVGYSLLPILGNSGLGLKVTGSGFVSQSIVDWSSTALATAYVSSTELTASIPPSDFATEGSFPVSVVNPTPGGGTSNALTFQVLAAPTNVYVDTTFAADPFGTPVTWTDGSTHFVDYDAFGTVQAGVSSVASGGTVHIAAGVYTEQVDITQSLTLDGAVAGATTIQAPGSLASGDLVTIARGASVTMSGFNVADGTFRVTGIADNGGAVSATAINISGCSEGFVVEDNGEAVIEYSTISDSGAAGIVVGSGTSDTSKLMANYDDLAGNETGVGNLQASGTINATFNWWGTPRGPTTSANPVGDGSGIGGDGVDFSPWLGDANLLPYDYLVFSTTTGSNYNVTPASGNTELVTSGGPFPTAIPGGDTLGFAGNGGTITIDGESSPSNDALAIRDTAVEFVNSDDHLNSTTINFIGTGMTRNVVAQGSTNTFYIDGAGVSGPLGTLEGGSGTSAFFFVPVSGGAGSRLLGSIQGGGASTLDYAAYPEGVQVSLGNGTDGTATGASGSVSGITAVIGSSFNDYLNAGNVPFVTLTGGPGDNELACNPTVVGNTDSVAESISSSYTLTTLTSLGGVPLTGVLTGTGGNSVTDQLSGIGTANLTGSGSSSTFNVSAWIGAGSLTSPTGIGTVIASKNATFVLNDSSLRTSDGMSLSLSGINNVRLTGTGNQDGFAINDWTGIGVLSATSGLLGLGVEDSSITLTDSSVEAEDMYLALNGFNLADLYEESAGSPSPGADTFNVSGWTHHGGLTGDSIASVTASESADITLTNSSLTSGTMSMSLNGMASADLTVTAATGHPALTINASAFSGTTHLTAAGTVDATLYGGAGGAGTLTATGSGNDILIGEAGETTLTDTGSGRNILIGGGAGGDSFVGGGNDILVSGTTQYDSNTGTNLAALDAILAEWTSSATYSTRINKIKLGVRREGIRRYDAFNAHTIQSDDTASTLSDRSILASSSATALVRPKLSLRRISPLPTPLPQSNNWFIASSHDHVTRRSNETKTII